MPVLVPVVLLFGAKSLAAGYWWKHRYRAYDPGWLVDLVRRQHPTRHELAAALEACDRARAEGRYYLRLKSRVSVALADEELGENLRLEDPVDGALAIDVRPDGLIAGVDFVGRRRRDAAAAEREAPDAVDED